MIINANALKRVANLYDLDWQPGSAMEQVVVTRTSQNISSDQITDALKAALITKGVTGEFELTVGNVIPSLTLAETSLLLLKFTKHDLYLVVTCLLRLFAAPSADNPVKTLSLSGVIERYRMYQCFDPPSKPEILSGSRHQMDSCNKQNLLSMTQFPILTV